MRANPQDRDAGRPDAPHQTDVTGSATAVSLGRRRTARQVAT